ncbi:MAG: valine--tRNA ligase [Myxococcota bacterium]|nr:valine--tRNA ligase [Myxococcota bacterium]
MSDQQNAELPKSYDPHQAAETYYPQWEAQGLFKGDSQGEKPPFSIVIPPPNVTGSLHMGHALDNTLQDILVRFKRMDGFDAVWIPGTDHAGIATQMVVERELRKEGLDRHELGREAFLEKIWDWKKQNGDRIIFQLRSLGVSCDWSRERFTMDEGLSAAVRRVFVKYYEEGLIYRDTRLINWDPGTRTVLSDLEVDYDEDHVGELWSFAYPLSDGSGELVVATTRPETMLGDTAVAVHPEDPRYKHLIGKTVHNPLVDRHIEIIGDAILVDPEFGTGAVKVTPAHDFNDYEVGRRHDLEFITMFDEAACVNHVGGERFQGMHRDEARKAVKAAMAELGLERGGKEHKHPLGRSQRGGAVVEPMLSTQWFVRMKPLAAPALAAVEHGTTEFVPKRFENIYFAWMRDIRDWCISRQLWWGHQIPAWYDADGKVYVGESEAAVREANELDESVVLTQDQDVLDTWFSSALWPFSTLGWPEMDSADLAKWYPTSVLVTGFDIIFFWVARMMFSGLHNMGNVPFAKVCIHGLVRDEKGEKMSKTKGNVVDPLDTIEKHGVDAFRFTLARLAAPGADMNWREHEVEVSSRFVNKIWQAFRFTMSNLEGYDPSAQVELGVYDRWILARLSQATERIRGHLESFRFDQACSELYAFTWDELCDWYLELSKAAIYGEGEGRQAAQHTLVTVFSGVARLMHPIMPFLSEELFQRLPNTQGSVMVADFPKASDYASDPHILEQVAFLQEAIRRVRRLRAEMEISPRIPFNAYARGERAAWLQDHPSGLKHLANVVSVRLDGDKPAASATAVIPGAEIFIDLEGVVDVAAEKERLTKEIAKVGKDAKGLRGKLGNEAFVSKAPDHVVAKFQEKLDLAEQRLAGLQASLASLG